MFAPSIYYSIPVIVNKKNVRKHKELLVPIATGVHLFPFRTESLSPSALMVLRLMPRESKSAPTQTSQPSRFNPAGLFLFGHRISDIGHRISGEIRCPMSDVRYPISEEIRCPMSDVRDPISEIRGNKMSDVRGPNREKKRPLRQGSRARPFKCAGSAQGTSSSSICASCVAM